MKKQLLLLVTMLLAVVMPMKLWAADGNPEPYAVLSDNNTKLTFFYDTDKDARGGMGVGPFEDLGSSGVSTEWYGNKSTITTVVFDDSFANCTTLTSTAYWFYQLTKLTTITGIQNLKMDNVNDINSMFCDCESLTSLNLSSLNLGNVTNMHQMFEGCTGLENISFAGVNTENVTNMGDLFLNCRSLKTIDLSSFNTSKVTNMAYMFYRCTSLTTVYVSDSWTTANVTNSERMFERCNNIVGGMGTTFDENVIDASYARIDGGASNPGYFTANNERVFNGKFVTTDYSSFAYALEDNGTVIEITDNNIVDDSEELGNRCIKIVSKDNATENWDSHFIIRIGEPLKEGQTYKFSMRAKASRNVSISSQARTTPDQYLHYRMLGNFDLTTGWQTYNVEGVVESEQAGCSVIALLLNVDKSSAEYFFDDISFRVNEAPSASPEPYAVLSDNNTKLTFFYDTEKDARGGMDVGPFSSSSSNVVPWYNQRENITAAEFASSFANCTSITSTAYWFDGCNNMVSISGIQYLNTANVTNMHAMFLNCSSLTNLDVSHFNTANVTDMSSMFERCFSLTSLDLNNFNTENVTDMHSMFDSCSRLASLNVSSFNTANVTDMGLMFSACYELTSLDVSGFNTDNVTDMHGMFGGSSGLTSLDLSNFKTDKVTTMFLMFEGCLGLTSLDLSSFNTENVTKFTNMFKECSNLKTIYVGSGWSTANVAEGTSMFYGCTNLVGGAGTAYDENHVDHTYAHIDGGTSNPGYFTAKNAPEGEAMFDGKVARVSGERTLDEAFEQRGGRAEATRTIAAIIWNKESALTESDLQGITNPNLLVYVNEARLAPSNVQNVVINGLAREIVLTDAQDGNNDWYAPQAFVAERISYTRNFGQSTTKGTSRGWESIALPFDVQTIQHESKGVIAPFNNSASNKHFWLRRLTENGLQAATSIEANTPYIISMPNSEEYTADYNLNGRVTFSAQNIDVPATTTKVLALADSSIVMVPAMQRQSRSSSVWALNVGEVRGQYFEGSVFERDYRTVRPFEAYTIHRQENGQPAPRYVPIQEIAGVTGIETIDREPLTQNQWYDMQGRKLEDKPARKGVYISNGKKVVVK